MSLFHIKLVAVHFVHILVCLRNSRHGTRQLLQTIEIQLIRRLGAKWMTVIRRYHSWSTAVGWLGRIALESGLKLGNMVESMLRKMPGVFGDDCFWTTAIFVGEIVPVGREIYEQNLLRTGLITVDYSAFERIRWWMDVQFGPK